MLTRDFFAGVRSRNSQIGQPGQEMALCDVVTGLRGVGYTGSTLKNFAGGRSADAESLEGFSSHLWAVVPTGDRIRDPFPALPLGLGKGKSGRQGTWHRAETPNPRVCRCVGGHVGSRGSLHARDAWRCYLPSRLRAGSHRRGLRSRHFRSRFPLRRLGRSNDRTRHPGTYPPPSENN